MNYICAILAAHGVRRTEKNVSENLKSPTPKIFPCRKKAIACDGVI